MTTLQDGTTDGLAADGGVTTPAEAAVALDALNALNALNALTSAEAGVRDADADADADRRRLVEERDHFRELAERLHGILDGVADGVTVLDRTGRRVFANSAAASLSGFESAEAFMRATPDEIRGLFELLDENGAPLPPERVPYWQVLQGADSATATFCARLRATGGERWSQVRATAVRDAAGELELVVNIAHDVTEEHRRREREAHLSRASAALAATLDAGAIPATLAGLLAPGLADGCSVLLLEGDRLAPAALTHVDRELIDAIGAVDREAPPDPEAPRGVWAVVRAGRGIVFEDLADPALDAAGPGAARLAAARRLGVRSLVIAPIRTDEKVLGAYVLIGSRTTRRFGAHELALAEELGRRAGSALENARLYEQARASAALAREVAARAEAASRVKDEFLAIVSHELRTPLSAILGWAMLLKGRSPDAFVARGVESIHRNASAQRQIVDDLLDASRIATDSVRLERRPVDLAALARDAVEATRDAAAAKSIAIGLELDEALGPCELSADVDRVRQVIANLLSNALKFTPSGGSVTVRVARRDGAVSLAVTDTGDGVHPDFLPRAFDRFTQADSSTTRRAGGLGLGLATAKHLVELHGGAVHAESPGPARGATFGFTLPIVASTERAPGEAEGPASATRAAAARLAGLRVVVVDDHADARELLQLVLLDAGAEVETAASADEALTLVKRLRPHVLVSDVAMPHDDGHALVRRVRDLDPALGGGVPSVALTAHARAEDKAKALASGFTTYLSKPIDGDELVRAVENLAKLAPRR